MDYNYAVKGDNQFPVKTVDVERQQKALSAILKTINAETLAIPKEKLALFPPRAYSYNRDRESFKGKTGVGFDPMSASVTAADMSLSLLLHPERINRVFQQKSLDENQIGLEEILDQLVQSSFGVNHTDTYKNDIQQLINERVLLQLMNLALSNNALFQVKFHANNAISKISRDYIYHKKKGTAYATQFGQIIKEFYSEPDKFKINKPSEIPDGAPLEVIL